MRLLFAPYKIGSASAKALSETLNTKRTKALKRFKNDVVVCNWGRADLVVRGNPRKVINNPECIANASDKLICLNILREAGVSCVEHTTAPETVKQWLAEGHVVYGRRLLNASQGKGIEIIQSIEGMIPYCPLYTKGILKSHEYRVHVFGDEVIDVAKKRRRSGTDTSGFIKNLANGWVYCREDIEIPDNLKDCARKAVKALGLDFGAVDVLYRKGVPYVLEINTAPGLQGTTLSKYVEKFKEILRKEELNLKPRIRRVYGQRTNL